MKRVFALLLAAIAVFSFTACGVKKQVFSSNGMTITLTEEFKEASYENFTVCFDSSKVAIFAIREDFETYPQLESYSLSEYAELYLTAYADRNLSDITEVEGIPSTEFTFYNESEGITYKYFLTMYEADDAFWCVQFACNIDSYDELKPDFINWAKTIRFNAE